MADTIVGLVPADKMTSDVISYIKGLGLVDADIMKLHGRVYARFEAPPSLEDMRVHVAIASVEFTIPPQVESNFYMTPCPTCGGSGTIDSRES